MNYASSKDGAAQVVGQIVGDGGKAVAVKGDVSKAAEAKGVVDAAIKAFGRLDVLVNNSGVYEMAPLEELTEAQFHRQFDINVLGVLLTTQGRLAAPEGRGERDQHLLGGDQPQPSGLGDLHRHQGGRWDSITGVLANELGPRGIRVNAINPGLVETEGTHAGRHHRLGLRGQRGDRHPARPHRATGRHRGHRVFLASQDSRWLTGEHIVASGGLR
ncbi:MAG: SDR family oxidoreductase [Caulobacteraceae bacterium]